MKTELPKATDCYWKIVDTILSCTRETHLRNTKNMIDSFNRMFPKDVYRYNCLVRIFNNMTKHYRVKQLDSLSYDNL